MLFVAGLSPSQAAPTKPAETATRDGIPCNRLCQAYMDWSDRVMATLHPRPPSQPQARIAARPKRAERPRQRMAATSHAPSKSFAQLPRRSDPAPRPTAAPPVESTAPPEPIAPAADQIFAADGNATEPLAYAGSATNEPLQITPVSLTAPLTATQAPGTASDGPNLRFALSLVLALSLVVLLAIMVQERSRGRTRGRTRAASGFR